MCQPFCRLSVTCDSFIPSTIRQWNSLNPSLRNVESIAKFKTELRKQREDRKPQFQHMVRSQWKTKSQYL
jgi:hypothetical protein